MTDFYEVLKLDASLPVSEVQNQLIRQESIWTDRVSTRPEKATEMLAVIAQAKKAFASDQAKAKYDADLAASRQPKTDNSRAEEFQKWKQAASDYFSNGQYDLAKTALEKAMPLSDENDAGFHTLACIVYRQNGQYQTALDHINKAIVQDPDSALLYINKAEVLELMGQDQNDNRYILQAREAMRIASQKAVAQSDEDMAAKADSGLAFLLYFHTPKDEKEARRLATRAVEHGDPTGDAKRVLEDIAKREEAIRRVDELANQRRKEMEEKKKRKEQARAQQQMMQQARQEAMEAKKKKAKQLYLAGWALMAVTYMMMFLVEGAPGAFLTMFVSLCAIFVLNYAEVFKNGYDSNLVKIVSITGGVVPAFKTSTMAYRIFGYSAAGAAKTWTIFGALLVTCFVLMFIAKVMGKKARG